MHALVCTALTGIAALRVEARAEPIARPCEVVVAVQAAGLNYPDLLMTTGSYQHKPDPPFVPGLEGAGVIVDIGPNGDRTLLGQRVMFSARGAFAERVAVAAAETSIVPEGWSIEQAAAFPVAGRTAFHALVHRAALRTGETLLVHGASGGVGHLAVKLGKALGAIVIATTGDPSKADFLRACGADHVVDTRCSDLADRIKSANNDRGVDVVLDSVGGALFDASLKAAAFGARILVVGFVAAQPNTVRTNYILIKGLSMLGVRAGEAARHNPAIAESYRTALPMLAAEHALTPHVHAAFAFKEAHKAFQTLAARDFVGKLVIQPSRESAGT
jgi:NADPH:quinone reductase